MFRLGKRLKAVADLVPAGARLADIGSDHAKLPIYLVETGRIAYALAGEVVKGPYAISLENTKEFPQITVRLANGLFAIEAPDEIDTVVIAGMGGLLISDILEERSEVTSTLTRLILQPNNEEAAVRDWLMRHHFKISQEKIIEDRDKIYEIIVAEKGEMRLSEDELKFGLFLKKEATFQKKWSRRLGEINYVLSVLPVSQVAEKQKLLGEIEQIERTLG